MADMENPPGGNWIGCCVCLNMTGRRVPASTVVKGYAVCDAHIAMASDPKFDVFSLTGRERRAV